MYVCVCCLPLYYYVQLLDLRAHSISDVFGHPSHNKLKYVFVGHSFCSTLRLGITIPAIGQQMSYLTTKCSYSFSVIKYICKNELHMQYSQLDFMLSLIYCCEPENHFEYLCMHGKKAVLVNAELVIHWVKTSGKEITVCAELHCLRFIFFFGLYASEALWNNLISIQ